MNQYLCRILPFTAVVIVAGIGSADAQATFRVVAYMNKYDQPGGIIEGSPGVFYSESGSAQQVALSITAQGTKTILDTFPTGNVLQSPLVSGANGQFYSTIWTSKTNTVRVFSVSSIAGSAKFYSPQSFDPIMMQNLPDGKLLGLGVEISSHIYNLLTIGVDGTVAPLYQFTTADLPETALYASDGNYYGVVQATTSSTGYIFRLMPSGSFTKVYTFPINTFVGPNYQPLLQATDGNLYGATATGGANGTGTIYKLTLAGQYTLLYTFPNDYNSNPGALIEGSDGNLYGATNGNPGFGGYSQLFRITKSGQYTLVYAMTNLAADGGCSCELVQGSDGIIYGVAQVGGFSGAGLYFALDAGLSIPKPRAQHFTPQSGAVGTQVRIWGYNLLSAAVQFNGVAATTVSNSGSNYVWATVPTGATAGPITITTPGGTSTTHASFTVQ